MSTVTVKTVNFALWLTISKPWILTKPHTTNWLTMLPFFWLVCYRCMILFISTTAGGWTFRTTRCCIRYSLFNVRRSHSTTSTFSAGHWSQTISSIAASQLWLTIWVIIRRFTRFITKTNTRNFLVASFQSSFLEKKETIERCSAMCS